MFSAEGNYLQEILVEESVRAADALARNAAASAWRALSAASPAAAALGVLAPPLALTPGVNLPIVLSLLAGSNGGAIALTLDDKRNLALLRSVAELASPEFAARLRSAESSAGGGFGGGTVGGFGVPRGGAGGSSFAGGSFAGGSFVDPEEVRRVVGLVRDLGPTVEPGVRRMGGEFATKLAKRLAERSREDSRGAPGAAGANGGGGRRVPGERTPRRLREERDETLIMSTTGTEARRGEARRTWTICLHVSLSPRALQLVVRPVFSRDSRAFSSE